MFAVYGLPDVEPDGWIGWMAGCVPSKLLRVVAEAQRT
jgi:hypothetical protein